jgi:hypothetical protein
MSLKVPDKFRKQLESLFSKGLTKAGKNPKKYWEEKRKKDDKVKPWKGFGGRKKTAAERVAQRYLSERVAARYLLAKEFSSPEALKEYLHEHPKADPKKHTVVKHEEKAKKVETKGIPKSKPLKDAKKVSRVGIPGDKVSPPPKLPRLQNLRPDEKEMESKMNDAIERDPKGAAKAFYGVAKGNNWVFETDGAKSLMPEWTRPDLPPDEKGAVHPERAKFRGKYNAILHQGANAIAKRAFLSRLDEIEKMPEDQRKVLVTSGGVAAGKGSALAAQPDLAKSVAATWDAAGEQNATENEWLLEECKKRGIKPVYLFVSADPKQSWPGVIERAKGIGRMVDAQLFADSYAVGAKNFNDFYEKNKDEASFVFGRFKGRGQPAEILDKMPEESLKLDADEIYDYASKYTDEKKADLPDFVYDGATIGRRVWA